MNEKTLFILADQTFLEVISHIKANQWSMTLPDWFQRGKSQNNVTLKEIIHYHAYDEAWIPDMLAGETMEEVGKDAYRDDLLGDDIVYDFSILTDKAISAVKSLNDYDRTVHCSFGDFKAREFLWQANSFRGFRSYDIAKLIGMQLDWPAELVQGLWNELSPLLKNGAHSVFSRKLYRFQMMRR